MQSLKGNFITLEPVDISHYDYLKEKANDKRIWTYATNYVDMENPFEPWFQDSLERHKQEANRVFTVIDNKTGNAVGTTSFYKMNHKYKSVAVGYTWYLPEVWGSYVNPECKLLLLTQAFEVLQFQRVEFEADSRNERSIKAMQRLGAKIEGCLRKSVYISDTFSKDMLILSIIDDEWPETKKSLLSRLAAYM